MPFPIGCDQLDPTRVYLHGTLRSATVGYEVTYDLTSKAWCGLIGQDVKPPSRPTIRKDGKLLYVEDGKVYAMTRDINLVYDDAYKHWTYDSTGIRARANDTELPTTCAALQLTSVFAWPDVNDFAVKCGTNVMTPMGAVLAATGAVHALGYTGHILAEDPTGLRELRVFDNVGGSLKVTAIGNTIGVHAVRAKADGFLVALTTGIGTPLDLWDVKFNASATKVGTYAAVPAGHTDTGGDVMDATGNLYATSVGPGGADFALKRPLQPAASTVVFDETNEEVKLHGDDFVTGP